MSTWLTYLLTLSIASVFNTVFQTLSSFFDKNLYCPRFVWIWFCFQPYIRRRQLWAEKWRFYLLLVSPCPLLPQCHLYQPHLRIVRPVSYLGRPCPTIATPLHAHWNNILCSAFGRRENIRIYCSVFNLWILTVIWKTLAVLHKSSMIEAFST